MRLDLTLQCLQKSLITAERFIYVSLTLSATYASVAAVGMPKKLTDVVPILGVPFPGFLAFVLLPVLCLASSYQALSAIVTATDAWDEVAADKDIVRGLRHDPFFS